MTDFEKLIKGLDILKSVDNDAYFRTDNGDLRVLVRTESPLNYTQVESLESYTWVVTDQDFYNGFYETVVMFFV